jgi:hypothetical protein
MGQLCPMYKVIPSLEKGGRSSRPRGRRWQQVIVPSRQRYYGYGRPLHEGCEPCIIDGILGHVVWDHH